LYLTSWTDAANLGIDALTHGIPVSPFLLSKESQQKFLEAGDHLSVTSSGSIYLT
jgi:hypothetical protein